MAAFVVSLSVVMVVVLPLVFVAALGVAAAAAAVVLLAATAASVDLALRAIYWKCQICRVWEYIRRMVAVMQTTTTATMMKVTMATWATVLEERRTTETATVRTC